MDIALQLLDTKKSGEILTGIEWSRGWLSKNSKITIGGAVTLMISHYHIFAVVTLATFVATTLVTGNVVDVVVNDGSFTFTRKLPTGSLILAYATSCENGGRDVIAEAKLGVNVIIWFATNLRLLENETPHIDFSLDADCIASVAKELKDNNLETSHLISIGGWDAPHPDTRISGEEWFRTWKRWNEDNVSRPTLNFSGFDGFDWDLEGNDDTSSPWNEFTQECLNLVGDMSLAAKKDGFLVTLVPPESYVDVSTREYDRSLRHRYPEDWHTDFLYHGRNVYSYFLAKYPGTWDLVDIQLYETFSHADYFINHVGMNPADYLVSWIQNVTNGWDVDFATDVESTLKNQTVNVAPERLIVGFSFGNTGGRTVFVWPQDVGTAFARLSTPPRGVMFWNIAEDRKGVFNGTKHENYTFASGFNAFLQTRLSSHTTRMGGSVSSVAPRRHTRDDGDTESGGGGKAKEPNPKRGFVADGNRTCDDPSLLDLSGWFYDYNVDNPYRKIGCSGGGNERLDSRFTPMNWCLSSIDARPPSYVNDTFFMGFNEPNNARNCNTSPRKIAEAWELVEKHWPESMLVSPATAGNGIPWFDQFFGNCSELYGQKGCRIDFIAAHDYSCEPSQTMSYLEALHKKYDKKIWLTEFSCGDHTAAHPVSDHLSFMREILPMLDEADYIYRYSWMSARDSSGRRGLLYTDGDGRTKLTELGLVWNDQGG